MADQLPLIGAIAFFLVVVGILAAFHDRVDGTVVYGFLIMPIYGAFVGLAAKVVVLWFVERRERARESEARGADWDPPTFD